MLAAWKGYEKCMEILLKSGKVDLTIKSSVGLSVMDYAHKRPNIKKLLKETAEATGQKMQTVTTQFEKQGGGPAVSS